MGPRQGAALFTRAFPHLYSVAQNETFVCLLCHDLAATGGFVDLFI